MVGGGSRSAMRGRLVEVGGWRLAVSGPSGLSFRAILKHKKEKENLGFVRTALGISCDGGVCWDPGGRLDGSANSSTPAPPYPSPPQPATSAAQAPSTTTNTTTPALAWLLGWRLPGPRGRRTRASCLPRGPAARAQVGQE